MKRILLFLLALLVAAPVLAQTQRARPLTQSPFKNTLYVSQDILLNGQITHTAKIAPLAVGAGGLAADRLVTQVSAFDVTGFIDTLQLGSAPISRPQAMALAMQWRNRYAPIIVQNMGAYLKKHSLANGFYAFSQEFNLQLESGAARKMAISWTMNSDASGRPVYGDPKIVDPDPLFIQAIYYPLTVAEGLPPEWNTSIFAAKSLGQIVYTVHNKRWEEQAGPFNVATGGWFDKPPVAEEGEVDKISCLMDRRYPGCSGAPVDIQGLIDKWGASAAVVMFVNRLEPTMMVDPQWLAANPGGLANEDGVEPDLIAKGAISYDDRYVSCGKLVNSGYFGYVMRAEVSQFLATPTSSLLKYQLIWQNSVDVLSPTHPFRKEKNGNEFTKERADMDLISPHVGDDSMFSRQDTKRMANVIYVSNLRSEQDPGSGELNVIAQSNDDVKIQLISHVGPVREYYMGTVGDNYWKSGTYDRWLQFTVNDLNSLPNISMIAQGFDDYMRVTINGHQVYNGPFGGDMLEVSPGPTVNKYTTARSCTSKGSQGWECEDGKSYYSCSEIRDSYDVGDSGVGYVTVGYTCATGCPIGLVQWTSTAYPYSYQDEYGQEYWTGGVGCNRGELSTSWVFFNQVDLRPFLVEGVNTIAFRVVVRGDGEGWIMLRTQACSAADVAPEGPAVPPPPAQGGELKVYCDNERANNQPPSAQCKAIGY